jgi:hypothetical protein
MMVMPGGQAKQVEPSLLNDQQSRGSIIPGFHSEVVSIQEVTMEALTEIVSIQLENGALLAARATSSGGEQDVASFKQVMPLQQVAATIEQFAASLGQAVQKAAPRKASVEFGIEMAVEDGQLTALLAQGAASSSIRVTLQWEKE